MQVFLGWRTFSQNEPAAVSIVNNASLHVNSWSYNSNH